MSRKDYIALSNILRFYDSKIPPGLITDIADWLQSDNPNFDRQKFIDACTR